jgi:hypothetical protein
METEGPLPPPPAFVAPVHKVDEDAVTGSKYKGICFIQSSGKWKVCVGERYARQCVTVPLGIYNISLDILRFGLTPPTLLFQRRKSPSTAKSLI